MRNTSLINDNWEFSKDNQNFETVTLPHTWNNMDGQNGGTPYHRGTGYYKKTLTLSKSDKKRFLQFEGVNHLGKVTFNGTYLGEHRGGFSTFRFDVTELVKEGENLLEVSVHNEADLLIYPQQADFTFFGGIYRNVSLIEVGSTHFDLEFYGSQGVYITPTLTGNKADVSVLSYVKGDVVGADVTISVLDATGKEVATCTSPASKELTQNLEIANPTLWDARKNNKSAAYLYTLDIKIQKEGSVLDQQAIPFGVRSFEVDKENGFMLNGDAYPLRGVSRHQCRQDKGWAISTEDQEHDIALINEVGANTIRLAHYQHNQYFYDLCDKEGQVLWAEIPFITIFMEEQEAVDNTKSQMHELVLQNYNHPSIFFWGISNEITIGGENEALYQNQRELEAIIKQYDKTRLTTLANVSFTPMESPENTLTDIVGYNHYFGWYGGNLEDNEKWIDTFHEKYPDRPLAITEYGAEGIMTLHTEHPVCRDYSEEYHAVYHEHMLKMFQTRPFLWGTYQWNMFDFAADGRDEGGVKGRNNKGLVSFDRKTKKDAFYLYKAYWNHSDEFVHVCGRRFVDRDGETTTIKVYSNEKEVTLLVNDVEVGTQTGDKIFVFENVSLQAGSNTVVAKTAKNKDEIVLNKVDSPNESYVLPPVEEQSEGVKNWFLDLQAELGSGDELTFLDGYFSIKDSLGDLLEHPEAGELLKTLIGSMGGPMNAGMLKMVSKMPLGGILDLKASELPDNAKAMVNGKLQKIKK